MMNLSRRQLLKGLGYSVAALSASPLASLASSGLTPSTSKADSTASALPCCDITIYQQKSIGQENVTLINHTDSIVKLDSIQPVGLESINGRLSVKVNNAANGGVSLQPGERLSFDIVATSKGSVDDRLQIPNVLAGHVNIRSNHPAFNGIIPVTVFDSQPA